MCVCVRSPIHPVFWSESAHDTETFNHATCDLLTWKCVAALQEGGRIKDDTHTHTMCSMEQRRAEVTGHGYFSCNKHICMLHDDEALTGFPVVFCVFHVFI